MAQLTTRSSVWRARDRHIASGTRGRHALLNSKLGRRAGKDAARSRVDRVDEPDAPRASRGRYLRVRHQTDEQTQEGDQYDKGIVLHSNGEPVRTKSSHRPGCSPRSTYATDDRWDYSRRPQSRSAAPEPLIRRLAAGSLSPACQRRKTHLAARARARAIELD